MRGVFLGVSIISRMAATGGWGAEQNVPRIVMNEKGPILILPSKLTQVIALEFPGMRVPGPGDMKGGWAKTADKNSVPYACWGDYNGDGLVDVALMLISSRTWVFQVFNQTKEGYLVIDQRWFLGPEGNFYLYNRPRDHRVFTLGAGKKLDKDDPGHELDTIIFQDIETPARYMQYDWFNAGPDSHESWRRQGGAYSKSGNFGD